MIAQRFRSIGWVAGCAAAALCCYLASQSVASERAALTRVDREIASTQSEIRRLTTEIAARGRMGQIERWNRDVLALQAPAPGQFVADEVQLASLAGGKPLPLDPAIVASKGATQTVAYQSAASQPAAPTAASADPMLRSATFVRPKLTVLEAPAVTGVVKANFVRSKPFELDLDSDPAPVAPKPAAKPKAIEAKASEASATVKKAGGDVTAKAAADLAKKVVADVKAKAKPMLTASLLPSDLGSLIAAEKKGASPARTPAKR